jgi:hypothetical protein
MYRELHIYEAAFLTISRILDINKSDLYATVISEKKCI